MAVGNFEKFSVKAEDLRDKIQDLVREGNLRRLVIKNKGKVFMEIPLSVLTASALLVPYLTAIGLFGALLTDCTMEIIRKK